jgi:hypothetical protein
MDVIEKRALIESLRTLENFYTMTRCYRVETNSDGQCRSKTMFKELNKAGITSQGAMGKQAFGLRLEASYAGSRRLAPTFISKSDEIFFAFVLYRSATFFSELFVY